MRVPQGARRPVPPVDFGTAPVMGDVLSVPERDFEPPPQPVRPAEQGYGTPLLVHLPAHLAPYFQIGFAHSDEICPLIIFRVLDEDTQQFTEIVGPAEDFMTVARTLAGICNHVPCINPVHVAEAQPGTSRRAG